jgi:hypothetical protein
MNVKGFFGDGGQKLTMPNSEAIPTRISLALKMKSSNTPFDLVMLELCFQSRKTSLRYLICICQPI